MPCSFKKSPNCLDIYSPPLSDRSTLMLCSDCLSTRALNSLNFSKHSLLALSMYAHTFLEKSSMKVRKYRAPPMDVVFIGPHTSECTISNNLVARLAPSLGKVAFVVCPLLFALNATFTCQRRHITIELAKVHATYHVLECLDTLHIQMAKAAMPHLQLVLFRWSFGLLKIGYMVDG